MKNGSPLTEWRERHGVMAAALPRSPATVPAVVTAPADACSNAEELLHLPCRLRAHIAMVLWTWRHLPTPLAEVSPQLAHGAAGGTL